MNALFLNFLDYRELLPSTNDRQHPYSFFYILGSTQTSATQLTILGQTHSVVLELFDRVVSFTGSQTVVQVLFPSLVNCSAFMQENSPLKDMLVSAEVLATSLVLNHSFNMLDNAADDILNKLNILAFCAVQTTLLAWGEEISMSGGDLTECRLIQ